MRRTDVTIAVKIGVLSLAVMASSNAREWSADDFASGHAVVAKA
jgi:hypothetical protein